MPSASLLRDLYPYLHHPRISLAATEGEAEMRTPTLHFHLIYVYTDLIIGQEVGHEYIFLQKKHNPTVCVEGTLVGLASWPRE